jgi:ATP-dependent DNA helicase RecG
MNNHVNSPERKSLGLVLEYKGREVPTNGAVLLFGKKRRRLFTDANIRCARFRGFDTSRFIDKTEIDEEIIEESKELLDKAKREVEKIITGAE